MFTFKQENLALIKEVKESEFGFDENCGDGIFVLRDNNKVVGFANVEIEGESAYISELEILSHLRGIGYGTTFINALFDKFKIRTLSGCAMYEAYDFWANLGADIYMPCHNCYNYENDCCEYEEGEICDEYTGEFTLERE